MSSCESLPLQVRLNCRKFTHYFNKRKEIDKKIEGHLFLSVKF